MSWGCSFEVETDGEYLRILDVSLESVREDAEPDDEDEETVYGGPVTSCSHPASQPQIHIVLLGQEIIVLLLQITFLQGSPSTHLWHSLCLQVCMSLLLTTALLQETPPMQCTAMGQHARTAGLHLAAAWYLVLHRHSRCTV